MKKESTVNITIEEKVYVFPYGVQLEKVLSSFGERDIPIVGALINGYVRALYYTIIIDCSLSWIDLTSNLGRTIYRNSQRLILLAAHNNMFPERKLHIKHSLGDGTYCESRGETGFNKAMLVTLKGEINRLIREEVPIDRRSIFTEDAKALYQKRGDRIQSELISASSKDNFGFYEVDKTVEAFHGTVVSNCANVPIFDLTPFDQGFILRAPTSKMPDQIEPNLSVQHIGTLFTRFDRWTESLNVSTIGELNHAIRHGKASQIIEMAEMMQTQNIFEIGQEIIKDIENIRVILIAGPSSSGKTTFSHKLSVFLRINGIQPVTMGMDNYFVDRDKTPLDEDGNYDFESISCIDLQRFDSDIENLINGETIETPIFDFIRGQRKRETRTMQMKQNQILVIEGIHCLNERIAANVPAANKRRIFMSALTQLNIDHYNPISSTDSRMIRRITRDKSTRNTSPAETIMRWESVQRGENINIYPFQENADFFCNTSLIYEMAVLKPYIEPELKKITTDQKAYNEAKRLLSILDFILPIDAALVPPSSLLREFIGGSAFAE
jgi:uridine kinase